MTEAPLWWGRICTRAGRRLWNLSLPLFSYEIHSKKKVYFSNDFCF